MALRMSVFSASRNLWSVNTARDTSVFFRCFSTTRKFYARPKALKRNAPVFSAAPSIAAVRSSSLMIRKMRNETLLSLSALNVPEAREELLKRHIMDIDSVVYRESEKTLEEIRAVNRKEQNKLTIPNKTGVVSAIIGGFVSFPLCFHHPTVHWFNDRFVTADIPEPKDLETWLEVGTWAWNWMEPVMGQMSFFLLCLAFARSQFHVVGVSPYSETIKEVRAKELSKKFPRYDAKIIGDFSKSQPFEWWIVNVYKKFLTWGKV